MKRRIVNSLELFSGAGGLAKGIESAGVCHKAFVEWNADACKTLRVNYNPDIVFETDIKDFNFQNLSGIDLIAGGPPCQPFSLGGKHKGVDDERDMFPYAVSAIRELQPKAFIFENVKGLLRKSFSEYFNYILLQLTYPELTSKSDDWKKHLAALEKRHTSGIENGLKYNVVYRLLNTADYGIPQKRERVIMVGIRNDLHAAWSFPEETHSLASLLWDKEVTGNYYKRHSIRINKHQNETNKEIGENLIRKYGFFPPTLKPWVTVRDAICDLPDPEIVSDFHPEHYYRKGARQYPGHTGSYIDLPSKAIKAGSHGVPGGENMIRFNDGSVRYYTVLEAKRIQTFPDDYPIQGSWTESMRQLGNAVPVKLGSIIAKSLISKL
jgi:DNA (cytosine-5)-methyltransferase 1